MKNLTKKAYEMPKVIINAQYEDVIMASPVGTDYIAQPGSDWYGQD